MLCNLFIDESDQQCPILNGTQMKNVDNRFQLTEDATTTDLCDDVLFDSVIQRRTAGAGVLSFELFDQWNDHLLFLSIGSTDGVIEEHVQQLVG